MSTFLKMLNNNGGGDGGTDITHGEGNCRNNGHPQANYSKKGGQRILAIHWGARKWGKNKKIFSARAADGDPART
jgi:hypothetical protein